MDRQTDNHVFRVYLVPNILVPALTCPVPQMNLPQDYPEVIKNWTDAWTKLRAHVIISETNKIHVINSDLKDYYDTTSLSLSR
jgi:hypothetical protein